MRSHLEILEPEILTSIYSIVQLSVCTIIREYVAAEIPKVATGGSTWLMKYRKLPVEFPRVPIVRC